MFLFAPLSIFMHPCGARRLVWGPLSRFIGCAFIAAARTHAGRTRQIVCLLKHELCFYSHLFAWDPYGVVTALSCSPSAVLSDTGWLLGDYNFFSLICNEEGGSG
jgi:hypothetical protein